MNEDNTLNVELDPIENVPISSYIVKLALQSDPTNYLREIEIPAVNPLVVLFSNLTNGETYQVTAISKLDSFESKLAMIGQETLRKFCTVCML